MTYFIIINHQQAGPYTLEELFDRHITSDTLVWAEGMANWTPAWQIEELRDILKGIDPRTCQQQTSGLHQAQEPTPPPYSKSQDTTDRPETDPRDTARPGTPRNNSKDKSKVALYSVMGFMAVLILLAMTAPDKKSHEHAVAAEMTEAISQKAVEGNNNDIMAEGFKMLNSIMTSDILDGVLDQVLEYHNYIIFSKTTVNFNNEYHTVSWGILGHVFTINAGDILKAIDKESPAVDTTPRQDKGGEQESSTDGHNTDQEADKGQSNTNIDRKIDQTVDKVSNHVENKLKQKVGQKLDQATDSSTIDKVIDKILNLL